MFHLNRLLNSNRETQPTRLCLETNALAELNFWYNYDLIGSSNSGGFSLLQGKIKACDLKVYHDASGHSWGYKIPLKRAENLMGFSYLDNKDDDNLEHLEISKNGSFPSHLVNASIEAKEAFGLLKGMEAVEENSNVFFYCTNSRKFNYLYFF